MKETTRKGFTLIELLIVIAILGVLAAAVTIVLNPAELLAEARDGQRVSDLQTITSAVSTYLSESASTTLELDQQNYGANGSCTSVGSALQTAPFNNSVANCTAVTSKATDGTGWVDVNLASLPGGSPLATLPVDPVNNGIDTYAYVGNDVTSTPHYTFKLAARLESVKFVTKEILGRASTSTTACTSANGTSQYCWYQVGTNLGL